MNFDVSHFLQNSKYNQNKRSMLSVLFDVIFYSFILFFILYMAFCTIFIQSEVIGSSMQPTFNKNLSILEDANKSQYKDIAFANRFNKGSSGDIVLINLGKDVVIKRIIAMEGDQVKLKKESDGYFYYYVNNKKLEEDYILDRVDMNLSYFNKFCFESEKHQNLKNVDVIVEDREAVLTVPKDCVYVLGDNRLVSDDSSSYGCVNTQKILGAVSFYYEYNQTFLSFIWQKICGLF